MGTNEIIRGLCKERGITIQKLEMSLGFSNASIAKANSNMKAQKLKAIADYFNVTMEYLLTGQKESEPVRMSPKLSEDERELMSRYLLLDQSDRDKLSAYLDGLLSADKYEKKEAFA